MTSYLYIMTSSHARAAGLVRGNKSALDRFNELEGYNVIVRAVQSDIPKVQLKSLFLVANVCVEFPEQCKLYVSMGLPQQVNDYM